MVCNITQGGRLHLHVKCSKRISCKNQVKISVILARDENGCLGIMEDTV
jgi:hypothetical protein